MLKPGVANTSGVKPNIKLNFVLSIAFNLKEKRLINRAPRSLP